MAAVSVTVVAVQLAGSKVTARPIPSVSSEHLQAALVGDALTLSNDQAEDPGDGTDSTATTGTGSGEPASGEPSADDHPSGVDRRWSRGRPHPRPAPP